MRRLLFLASILVMGPTLTVLFAVGAYAAEPLAKNGTGTLHSGFRGVGTTTPTADKRLYWMGSFWGVSFNDEGKGLFHDAVWNCPAISDIYDNTIHTKGSCAVTDTDGDRFSVTGRERDPLEASSLARSPSAAAPANMPGCKATGIFTVWVLVPTINYIAGKNIPTSCPKSRSRSSSPLGGCFGHIDSCVTSS